MSTAFKIGLYKGPLSFAAGIVLLSVCCGRVFAAAPECEVLSVKGTVSVLDERSEKKEVREGDLLPPGSMLETGPDSYADLAYDKDWKNVSRIEPESQVNIASLTPAKLALVRGGVHAKLRALPKKSTFVVESPAAIAVVRGTEYRATYREGGPAEVSDFSDSEVQVFGMDIDGGPSKISTVLKNGQKAQVSKAGDIPGPPQIMTDAEMLAGKETGDSIDASVAEAGKAGRTSKLQDGEGDPAGSEKADKDPETVLREIAASYEAKDLRKLMSRISEGFPMRDELEEFIRRDFRDYDGIKLNFFVRRVETSADGAHVRADWEIQYFPTATSSQMNLRGDDLDLLFVMEEGLLKLKAQRGSNPFFGARSPELAALSGVSSATVRVLQTIEDSGTRAVKQTALGVVARQKDASRNQSTPVNADILSAQAYDVVHDTTVSLTGMVGPITLEPQLTVRLTDNPTNVSLYNVAIEVTDSVTGRVLRGSGDLLAGQTNIIRTSDQLTINSTTTGRFTFVLDPDRKFGFIDRTQARTVEDYNTI